MGSSGTISLEEQYRMIGTARLHYWVAGQGKPLILLHGLSGSSRWWRYNTPVLAEHFRVYLVDLIGFGRSRRQRFGLHQASRILAEWMTGLGPDPMHLMGHSMGGYISADLAANHPHLVERLVLVDALALPIRSDYTQTALGLLHALRYMPANFLPVLVADAFRAGPATLLRAAREVFSADFTNDLERLQAPTMIVWGEKDKVLPPEMGYGLRQYLPSARFVEIAGAGHNPMWDRPEPFNQAVLAFLQEGEV